MGKVKALMLISSAVSGKSDEVRKILQANPRTGMICTVYKAKNVVNFLLLILYDFQFQPCLLWSDSILSGYSHHIINPVLLNKTALIVFTTAIIVIC